MQLKGTRDGGAFPDKPIKRVRLIRRAEGYYVQCIVAVERRETITLSQTAVGLDLGLTHFYTDSTGAQVDPPRFLRKAWIRRAQRRVTRKQKGGKNPSGQRLAQVHLKGDRQRKDFAIKLMALPTPLNVGEP